MWPTFASLYMSTLSLHFFNQKLQTTNLAASISFYYILSYTSINLRLWRILRVCHITFTTFTCKKSMMSSSRRAWTVAISVGVVETLKDQGLCRWNSAFKSAQQSVKSHLRSLSQAKKLSSSSSAMLSSTLQHGEKAKHSEESLRTVMYLSCWGPNWEISPPNLMKFCTY